MRKKILMVIVMILALLLTGCYSNFYAVKFDQNWQGRIKIAAYMDEMGPSDDEISDIAKRINLLSPANNVEVTASGNILNFLFVDAVPIEEIPFMTKEVIEDGVVKVAINIPTLVTCEDYSGEPKGADLFLVLFVPGEIIEANSFDIENGKTVDGDKTSSAQWQLTAENLTSPKTLWVKVKPY